jgi:dihydrofolate synthase/folylpolyglutamate synthase
MFEVVFATFALVCQDAGCQAAVLEVGLGGRLDATNVVKTCFSIICSVSLDHTRILGSTIEAIASVKSGIFKKDVPCLVGKYCPVELLREKANEVGAPFNFIGDVLDMVHVVEEKDGLPVDGAKDCTAIARCALTLLKSQLGGCFQGLVLHGADFEKALDKRPPCRWQVLDKAVSIGGGESRNVHVVMDVGHNPAAVAALATRIRMDLADFDVYIVYAASRGKDVGACMRAIGGASSSFDKVIFAECNYFRAITIEELRTAFEEAMEEPSGLVVSADGTLVRGVSEVLRATLERAAAAQQHSSCARLSAVVVCGSLYMMAEARRELGMVEARD